MKCDPRSATASIIQRIRLHICYRVQVGDEMNEFDRVSRDEERKIRDAHLFAQKRQPEIMGYLSRCDIFSKAYAIRSRVKGDVDILKKLERKRAKDTTYNLGRMTDLIGLRFITLYREDVLEIIDEICRMISGQHDVRPCPFKQDILDEFIVYTTTVKGDTSNISGRAEKIVHKYFGSRVAVDTSERATYSSVHLVVRLNDGVDGTLMPIEIQIRSVFEDAWSEIDHKLRYSQTRASHEEALAIPTIFESHLRHLKSFLDSAAGYADTIRRDVRDTRASGGGQTSSTARIKNNLDTSGSTIKLLKGVGLSGDLLDAFGDLLQAKDILDESAKAGNPPENELGYEQIAEGLHKLYEQERRPGGALTQDGVSARYLTCILRMEEALCLLLSGQSVNIREAISIYEELEPLFKDVAALQFRLGQAYSMLGESDHSISHYSACLNILTSLNMTPASEREFQLPEHQKTYLEENVYRFLGYEYWHRAKYSAVGREPKDVLDDFVMAYNLTARKIENSTGESRFRLLNNCLFYAVEAVQLANKESLGTPINLVNQINSHLADIVNEKPVQELSDPYVLDTLAYAYSCLGAVEPARHCAKRVMDIVLSEGRETPTTTPSQDGDPMGAKRSIVYTRRYTREARDAMTRRAWSILHDG